MLSNLYPEQEWLPWEFAKCPRSFWDDKNNQKKYMEWAGKQLKVKEMSDWYKLTQQVKKYTKLE
jgi:hypothetical protein